jgi:hypothetical protein
VATADTHSSAMTPGAPKPSFSALITANVKAVSAAAPSTVPEMSTRCASGSEFSGSTNAPAIRAARPNATLNQKIARQLSGFGPGGRPGTVGGADPPIVVQTPMSAPPMTGPRARASPDTAVHTPMARARIRFSGYR